MTLNKPNSLLNYNNGQHCMLKTHFNIQLAQKLIEYFSIKITTPLSQYLTCPCDVHPLLHENRGHSLEQSGLCLHTGNTCLPDELHLSFPHHPSCHPHTDLLLLRPHRLLGNALLTTQHVRDAHRFACNVKKNKSNSFISKNCIPVKTEYFSTKKLYNGILLSLIIS